jgi:hypothetical protein
MFHDLFEIAAELREIERERERLRGRKAMLQRRFVSMAQRLTGKHEVPVPWKKQGRRPNNVIELKPNDTSDYGQQRQGTIQG